MSEVADKVVKKGAKVKGEAVYPKETYIEWYTIMLRIRRFEEAALKAYSLQKIRGFLHVYIGQEAIAAGIKTALRPEDKVLTGYRQHGIALTKGLTSKSCMAELFGKVTGAVKGKGGSMHFSSKEHNYIGGNGIVGAQIPIGAGVALAEKYRGTDNLSLTMFGDGAARQGALHEAFNMAMTWKLPVLYVVENNQYAMGTSVERTTNVHDIYKLGLGYDMPSEQVDGMSPEAVHEAMDRAAKHIRSGKGPYFLEIKTYRYRGHSVSDPGNYRSKDEVKEFKEKDPIALLEEKMIAQGLVSEKEFDAIKLAVKEEIAEAVEFADKSDFPLGSELYDDNYVQKDYPFIMD